MEIRFAAALLAAGILAGCGGGSSSPVAAPATAARDGGNVSTGGQAVSASATSAISGVDLPQSVSTGGLFENTGSSGMTVTNPVGGAPLSTTPTTPYHIAAGATQAFKVTTTYTGAPFPAIGGDIWPVNIGGPVLIDGVTYPGGPYPQPYYCMHLDLSGATPGWTESGNTATFYVTSTWPGSGSNCQYPQSINFIFVDPSNLNWATLSVQAG